MAAPCARRMVCAGQGGEAPCPPLGTVVIRLKNEHSRSFGVDLDCRRTRGRSCRMDH